MKKEILESLKAKFPGVSEAILGRIVDKLAKTITTVEDVTTAVEGVSIQQVIESYGDSRATEAQQTAVHSYEKKYGLKDGQKNGDKGGAATHDEDHEEAGKGAPEWAKQLIDSYKKMSDRLDRMDGDRLTATRKQQLSTVVDKLPENLRKAYARTNVEGLSEEDFNTLIKEVTTEVDGIVKETAAKGAVFGRPAAPRSGSKMNDLTKEQQEIIAHRDNKPEDSQPF